MICPNCQKKLEMQVRVWLHDADSPGNANFRMVGDGI